MLHRRIVVGAVVASLAFLGSLVPMPAFAQAQKCGGVTTAIISCPDEDKKVKTAEGTAIWSLLLQVLNIMTAGVGIVAVGAAVYAALLYTTAEANSEQTKKAAEMLWNIGIGIVSFGGIYLLLNFIVPGGVFTK